MLPYVLCGDCEGEVVPLALWAGMVPPGVGKGSLVAPDYPDSFSSPTEASGIAIAWLVRIKSAEAQFVRSYGGNGFERLVERINPDLLNLRRKSIV
ncbi:MAG TPA: hypothetical protein VH370_20160 [Humisphaera sp.]|nr:hypothetical protein [Humisphaera sp.]